MYVRAPARPKRPKSVATLRCKCGQKWFAIEWVLNPCGCVLERTCIQCGDRPSISTLTSVEGGLSHECGHVAPVTSWHVTRKPLIGVTP